MIFILFRGTCSGVLSVFGCVTKIHEVINQFPKKYRSHATSVSLSSFYGDVDIIINYIRFQTLRFIRVHLSLLFMAFNHLAKQLGLQSIGLSLDLTKKVYTIHPCFGGAQRIFVGHLQLICVYIYQYTYVYVYSFTNN